MLFRLRLDIDFSLPYTYFYDTLACAYYGSEKG